MEHLSHWMSMLARTSDNARLVWFIGCALLVVVWAVGFRMAQPRTACEGACVPSSPFAFALVIVLFVALNAGLAFFAYDLYMTAHPR